MPDLAGGLFGSAGATANNPLLISARVGDDGAAAGMIDLSDNMYFPSTSSYPGDSNGLFDASSAAPLVHRSHVYAQPNTGGSSAGGLHHYYRHHLPMRNSGEIPAVGGTRNYFNPHRPYDFPRNHHHRNIWLLETLNYIISAGMQQNRSGVGDVSGSNSSLAARYPGPAPPLSSSSSFYYTSPSDSNFHAQPSPSSQPSTLSSAISTAATTFYRTVPDASASLSSVSDRFISGNAFASVIGSSDDDVLRDVNWRHPLLAVLLVAFCLLTIAGNCLVVVAVCTKKYLRNPTGYLVVSLAVADLIVGLVVMPLNSLFEMSRHVWLLGLTMCDLFHALDILASTSSIWNLCVISLDRYMAGHDPIGYRDRVSKRRIIIAIAFVWVMSLFLSFPAIAWWRYASPQLYEKQTQCLFTDSQIYVVFSSLVSFYIPLILILFSYGSVFLIATRHTKSIRSGIKKVQSRRGRAKKSSAAGGGARNNNAAAGGGENSTMRIHLGRKTKTNNNCRASGRDPPTLASMNSAIASVINEGAGADTPQRQHVEWVLSRGRMPSVGSFGMSGIGGTSPPSLSNGVAAARRGVVSGYGSTTTFNGGGGGGIGSPQTPGCGDATAAGTPTTVKSPLAICSSVEFSVSAASGQTTRINTPPNGWQRPSSPRPFHASLSSAALLSSASTQQTSAARGGGRRPSQHYPRSPSSSIHRARCATTTNAGEALTDCFASTPTAVELERHGSVMSSRTVASTVSSLATLNGGRSGSTNSRRGGGTRDGATIKSPVNVAFFPNNFTADGAFMRNNVGRGIDHHHSNDNNNNDFYQHQTQHINNNSNNLHVMTSNGHHTVTLLPNASSGGASISSSGSRKRGGVGGMREKSRQMMKYVHEQRAARTLSIVVGVFILCWTPFFILSPIMVLCKTCIADPETFFSVITWAGHLNSMLNPLIYSRFSRDFRKAFKQILTCERERSTKKAIRTPLNLVLAQLASITQIPTPPPVNTSSLKQHPQLLPQAQLHLLQQPPSPASPQQQQQQQLHEQQQQLSTPSQTTTTSLFQQKIVEI